MFRKGNCRDNAVVESFFAGIKVEATHGEHFQTRKEIESEGFDYIERFYNRKRTHSTFEYLSPNLYELKYKKPLVALPIINRTEVRSPACWIISNSDSNLLSCSRNE
ncbi:MAG: IS3 family transposase [Bdellovibrionales bacterium]|nr:IS3 family transposase [Bdellovibrionales bacterium]